MPPLVAQTPEELIAETDRLSKMIAGRQVAQVWRHRPGELAIQFADGTRLFVNWQPAGLELSVTNGAV